MQPSSINTRILNDLQNAYMEVIPVPNIEKKLEGLSRSTHLAVTCSPTKGVDETIELSSHLVDMGFEVTPHIAAKCVTDNSHLSSIIQALKEKNIKSVFVPGGTGQNLLEISLMHTRLVSMKDMNVTDLSIGIAAHPEGHPDIKDEVLINELIKKKDLADYVVTQMCFDANILGDWLIKIKNEGVDLPVWVGLPGVIERGRLLRTSLRIGVEIHCVFSERRLGSW